MVTQAEFADINRLSEQLRERTLEFEPRRPEMAGVYMLELHIKSSNLRSIRAVNAALQLAFDAACAAHLDWDPTEAPAPVELELIWAAPGSMREVFMLSPRTSLGRDQLNYLVGSALQALPMIPGLNPAFGFGLYLVFAGSMLVASTYDPTVPTIPVESVDVGALSGVQVQGRLYPPGKIWRAPSSGGGSLRLVKLSEYVSSHEEDAFFSTMHGADGYYVVLVVEGKISESGKASAIAQWHADENALPCG